MRTPDWQSDDGRIQLHCCDCRSLLDGLEVDAVVTDPPYGIGCDGCHASTREWEGLANDDGSLDLRPMLAMPCRVVSFGANNYPEQLPHRGRWLCWDKRVNEKADAMLGQAFELAWSNRRAGFGRIYRIMHGGVVNADGCGIHGMQRVHPTQKPIDLMRRIIEDETESEQTICDPFFGSGTTAIACIRTNRKFIGCEIDHGYFADAVKRIEKELDRTPLFEREGIAI